MSNSITFLHAADLHLDSPFKGFTHIPSSIFSDIQNSTFLAFDKLIETAIEKRVDFILLVGDLFDEAQQSLKAQLHLKKGFEKLYANHIQVFITYGNHDFIKGNIFPIEYPKNVHIFSNEKVSTFVYEREGKPLAKIYGFSYENREVTENKSLQYEISNETIPFHIAMLHGTLHGQSGHDPYAPFRLQDLLAKSFNYWALGHIHKRAVIHRDPYIVYPGNIQGRHAKEAGEKGCYLVEMNPYESTIQFISLQSIMFNNITLDIDEKDTIHTLEEKISVHINDHHMRELIRLTFHSSESFTWFEKLDELLDLMNETLIEKTPWQFIYKYDVNVKQSTKAYDQFFTKEIKAALNELDVPAALTDLTRHPIGRKHVQLKKESQLVSEAYEWLVKQLTDVGR